MKKFILLMLISNIAFSYDRDSKCHLLKDKMKRESCEKTQLEILMGELSDDRKSWRKDLSPKLKQKKLERLNNTLRQQTYYLTHMNKKLKILRSHRDSLLKAETIKPPKKDPKAQKDLGKALDNLGLKKKSK